MYVKTKDICIYMLYQFTRNIIANVMQNTKLSFFSLLKAVIKDDKIYLKVEENKTIRKPGIMYIFIIDI